MLVGSDGELRKYVFLLESLEFSMILCLQGGRNGSEYGAVVLGGSRDLGRKTGQKAMCCRVVIRGAEKGIFNGLYGAG